uniref:SJCHGC04495 protein n=1 Tax=Schistosoma japonicum TaxID=6182 RepID=Q5DAG7_SCHJA|nr:SJCHGC04495 protein [Schistosoma japonicum]
MKKNHSHFQPLQTIILCLVFPKVILCFLINLAMFRPVQNHIFYLLPILTTQHFPFMNLLRPPNFIAYSPNSKVKMIRVSIPSQAHVNQHPQLFHHLISVVKQIVRP